MNNQGKRKKLIIPVAGGKGGVGKSLFTSSLARELAARGYKTVAVDLDLGGSNLHSYFGIENNYPGIGDYINSKGSNLEEFTVQLEPDHLHLIPGDGLTPFLANMNYGQKQRLMRGLSLLDADYILLDLGSGASYNILDFFRMSNRGIVVTTPSYPAIMNMLSFLKNAVLRVISKGIGTNVFLREVLVKACHQTMTDEMIPVSEVIYELSKINPKAAVQIQNQIQSIHLSLVVNLVSQNDDLGFVDKVVKSLQKRLGIKVDLLATYPEDERSCWKWTSTRGTLPLLAGMDEVVYAMQSQRALFVKI